MHKVDLSPFQRRLGTVDSLRSSRLDALDVADVLDLVGRTVAAVAVAAAGQSAWETGARDNAANDSVPLHRRRSSFPWCLGRQGRVERERVGKVPLDRIMVDGRARDLIQFSCHSNGKPPEASSR